MAKWSPSRSTGQNPSKIDQTYRAPGPPVGMPNYWPRQQQWQGSSSCSVWPCRGRIRSVSSYRSVAAPGSVPEVLQRQEQERRSVWERYRSVAGAGSGALQRLGALQQCCRGRIRSVAASGSVTGALQEQDQVSGARFVTLSRNQDRSRGRICDVARVCDVDRVPGLL